MVAWTGEAPSWRRGSPRPVPEPPQREPSLPRVGRTSQALGVGASLAIRRSVEAGARASTRRDTSAEAPPAVGPWPGAGSGALSREVRGSGAAGPGKRGLLLGGKDLDLHILSGVRRAEPLALRRGRGMSMTEGPHARGRGRRGMGSGSEGEPARPGPAQPSAPPGTQETALRPGRAGPHAPPSARRWWFGAGFGGPGLRWGLCTQKCIQRRFADPRWLRPPPARSSGYGRAWAPAGLTLPSPPRGRAIPQAPPSQPIPAQRRPAGVGLRRPFPCFSMRTHTDAHMYTHACVHAHTCTHVLTWTHTCMHTQVHTQ